MGAMGTYDLVVRYPEILQLQFLFAVQSIQVGYQFAKRM